MGDETTTRSRQTTQSPLLVWHRLPTSLVVKSLEYLDPLAACDHAAVWTLVRRRACASSSSSEAQVVSEKNNKQADKTLVSLSGRTYQKVKSQLLSKQRGVESKPVLRGAFDGREHFLCVDALAVTAPEFIFEAAVNPSLLKDGRASFFGRQTNHLHLYTYRARGPVQRAAFANGENVPGTPAIVRLDGEITGHRVGVDLGGQGRRFSGYPEQGPCVLNRATAARFKKTFSAKARLLVASFSAADGLEDDDDDDEDACAADSAADAASTSPCGLLLQRCEDPSPTTTTTTTMPKNVSTSSSSSSLAASSPPSSPISDD